MSKSFKKFPADSAPDVAKIKKQISRTVRRVNKVKVKLEEEPLLSDEIVDPNTLWERQDKTFHNYGNREIYRKPKPVEKLIRK